MRGLAAVLAVACFAVPAIAAKPKVAVLDVATTGIEASLVPLLTEVLTVEVDNLGRYDVMAGSDVRALIGFEKQRDLLGCSEASCLAELGGALGVDAILLGNIGRLGSTYIVNIKLIDIKKVATLGRVYESVQGEIDVLLATIRTSVRKLFASAALTGPTPPAAAVKPPPAAVEPPPAAATSVPEPSKPRPEPTLATSAVVPDQGITEPAPAVDLALAKPSRHFRLWTGPLVSWGVGALALGAGVMFGLDARRHHDASVDPTAVGRQTEIDPGKTSQGRANLSYGLGAVAVAVGLGLYIWGGTAPAEVALAPGGEGFTVLASIPLSP